MARQYRGGDQPAGANTTSRSFTIPAGAQVGDLIVAWWVLPSTGLAGGDTFASKAPAGWTFILTTDATGTDNLTVALYAKTVAAGEPGSTVTFTFTTGQAASRQLVGCGVWYDDTGLTLSVEGSASSSSSFTTPTLNTVAANCFGIAGAASRRATGIETFTPPAGWAERLDAATDSGTGGKSSTTADKLATVAAGTNLGGAMFVGDGADHSRTHSWVLSIAATGGPSNPGAFLAHM